MLELAREPAFAGAPSAVVAAFDRSRQAEAWRDLLDASVGSPARSTIRRARPDEAGLLTGIALRSKAHWGYDEAFLTQAASDLTFTADELSNEQVWLLETAGDVLGFHRFRPGEPALLVDLWLEPSAIGGGHGRRLWVTTPSTWRERAARGRSSSTPTRTPSASTSGWVPGRSASRHRPCSPAGTLPRMRFEL